MVLTVDQRRDATDLAAHLSRARAEHDRLASAMAVFKWLAAGLGAAGVMAIVWPRGAFEALHVATLPAAGLVCLLWLEKRRQVRVAGQRLAALWAASSAKGYPLGGGGEYRDPRALPGDLHISPYK
jgi:FtsH-binding integral membrane protein